MLRRFEESTLERFTNKQRTIDMEVSQPSTSLSNLLVFEIKITKNRQNPRSIFKRFPTVVAQCFDTSRRSLIVLSNFMQVPQKLRATKSIRTRNFGREQSIDAIVEESYCLKL